MTPQTLSLANLTLHNSTDIIRKEMSGEPGFTIYDHDEINLMLRSIYDAKYNEPFDCTGYDSYDNSAVAGGIL